MPYYKDTRSTSEKFHKRSWVYQAPTGYVPQAWTEAEFVREKQETTSFRTRPLTEDSVELLDFQADPYGYFLNSYDVAEYQQNLKDRGIAESAGPDTGHPFDTMSFRAIGTGMDGTVYERVYGYSGGTYKYYGEPRIDFKNRVMLPAVNDIQNIGPFTGPIFGPANFPSSDLPNFGQRAIHKTAPSLVKFDLGRTLAELKEGIPRLGLLTLAKRLKDVPRAAGDDFLNIQFGWLPLLSDLKDAVDVLMGATALLGGLPEQGKPIRRTWGLPPKITSELWTSNGLSNAGWSLSDVMTAPQGSGSIYKRLTRKQWFVGSYTTFYPLGFDANDFVSRAQHMMSIKLTPQTLWELTPWSWLVDWGIHIGDSIAANQAAADDTLHIHYAYAMESTKAHTLMSGKVDNTYTPTTSGYYVRTSRDHFAYQSETEWKRRIRANPFGFTSGGLSGLSASQIATLTALGLSRT